MTGADGAPVLSSVTRTSTDSGPGSARAIVPVHPLPPPCGQSHAFETAVPRAAAAGVTDPARSATMPPRTTRPATTSARAPCPIVLIAPIRSSSDRLPRDPQGGGPHGGEDPYRDRARRSEEHTSELQSQFHLVCRLLLEKKNKKHKRQAHLSQKHKTKSLPT